MHLCVHPQGCTWIHNDMNTCSRQRPKKIRLSITPPCPALSAQESASLFVRLCFCLCACLFLRRGGAYQAVFCMACYYSVERRRPTTNNGEQRNNNRRVHKKKKPPKTVHDQQTPYSDIGSKQKTKANHKNTSVFEKSSSPLCVSQVMSPPI